MERLYWRDPTVNSCPKEKLPGSPRTFSTVPYPTPEPAAFAPSDDRQRIYIPFLYFICLCYAMYLLFRPDLVFFSLDWQEM
ncbi:hypothetical protein AXF42_Ash007038 [Apostasia shenzhenica]|uniref:Uncharacterized protein n=1 Tax=Apostasia shenzhenica TaxID=1088818 RepID=A0A2I0BEW8_9ASPA|nr:hypothetical protein AXF42_Ash007038 [Apostasia shenzhenica]